MRFSACSLSAQSRRGTPTSRSAQPWLPSFQSSLCVRPTSPGWRRGALLALHNVITVLSHSHETSLPDVSLTAYSLGLGCGAHPTRSRIFRSEEHTSEL